VTNCPEKTEACRGERRLRRTLNEHDSDLDTDGDERSSDTNEPQNNRAAIPALDSKYDHQLKIVTFFDLIRMTHFEPSLRPRRQAREGGEKCGESLYQLTMLRLSSGLRIR